MIAVKNEGKTQEFGFDGVFKQGDEYETYVTMLLPLLELALYQNKDATVIGFGTKRTGEAHWINAREDEHVGTARGV